MYTAIVLDKDSRNRLLQMFSHLPQEWELICHHMTINMGPSSKGPASGRVGEEINFIAKEIAEDDKVIAIGLQNDLPTINKKPHVTIAVNRSAGGKPVMSNNLTNWQQLPTPIYLSGTIEEV